jgi:hypothetical protein
MAKIRTIIIEGEMTPAELRAFADAFWNDPTKGTVRAVASTEVDLRGTPMEEIKANNQHHEAVQAAAPAPVAAPAPAPVVEAPAADERLAKLKGAKRMNELLAMLQEEGFTTLEQMMAECRKLQPHHPGLQKLGEGLEDRITRTWEGMQ